MLVRFWHEDRYDYILALYLAQYAGLRVRERFRIDTATVEQALQENAITVKGKGGKVRAAPINEQIAIALQKQLGHTERDYKLLGPDDVPTDWAIHRPQHFMIAYRAEAQDEGSGCPVIFNGLRHTCAAEAY